MKKVWKICLVGFFGLMVCGASTVQAVDTLPHHEALEGTNATGSEDHAGLTPRGKVRKPAEHSIILAQHPAPNPPRRETPPSSKDPFLATAPTPAAPAPEAPTQTVPPVMVADATPVIAPSHSDSYVYSELERLAAELDKVKKDTKKPDGKKGWESPKITGRLFLDTYALEQNDRSFDHYGDLQNKAGVREMQIAVSGKGFDSFDYKMEFSLAPNTGRVNLVDNWIGVKNLPLLGYVRAGHFKPETGLTYPASALHTTLTEFTGPTSAFGFGRRFGVAAEETFCKDRIRLFYGIFQEGATNTNRYIQEDNQGQVFNVRLSAAPVFEKEGRHVLHLGGHWSYASTKDGSTSVSGNVGSIAWLPTSISTGSTSNDTFACNHHNRAGIELAYQRGAFAVQSEAFVGEYAGYKNQPGRTATGAYVELKYFLTGEHRSYDLKKGMFGAVKMKNNFHPHKVGDWNLVDGFGAWQVVVQWSYLDLGDWRDVSTRAGQQNDVTLGLNWFWTPNIRWIFEYVHSEQNISGYRGNTSEDIFGTSLRLHF